MKGVKNNLPEKQKSGCSTNEKDRAQGRAIWGALQHPQGKEKRLGLVQHKLWAAEQEVRWSRLGMKQQGDCRK